MKRAQINMMETIVVLFLFFLIVFIGLIFYTNFAAGRAREKIEQAGEIERVQIAQIASSLPELRCSQDNVPIPDCIDLLKAEVARTQMQRQDYFPLLGFGRLSVDMRYPRIVTTTVYEAEPGEWTTKAPTYFPITIYDAREDRMAFGILVSEVYR